MQQVVDFILELDKLKGVTRKTRPLGLDRYENSAEHSRQIAVLASSMSHYAEEPIDITRVIEMLLVHDIGEIDTGDTLVYVEHGWEERKASLSPVGPHGRASSAVRSRPLGGSHGRGTIRPC